MKPAVLVLEDGAVFEGESFGADREAFGEVVFNTGMAGYQEVLTDPSYEGQIVAMTYPHIGNYGVNNEDGESAAPWVNGFVVRDVPSFWSSWRGTGGLEDYLAGNGISGITEVDTRRLTRHIRNRGAMRGVISTAGNDIRQLAARAADQPSVVGADLTAQVSCAEPYQWQASSAPSGRAPLRVAAYDFGIKRNILRQLAVRGCTTTIYPALTPAAEVLADNPDGVFISNGPGDPAAVAHAIKTIGQLLGKVPLFGICLGHQLVALAAGLETYKMSFGHHGVNHPVARLGDGAIQITTQNHGFAVKEAHFGFESGGRPGSPLPSGATAVTSHGRVELTHINLNDFTVEGFRLLDERAACVQYHPEAGPGPHDSRYLFDDFVYLMQGGDEYGKR